MTLRTTATKRILIVDDNADQVQTLAELLRLEGHRVEYATNALYALTLARDFHPELILLDIRMPMTDGYEALRKFKQHFLGARLVAISGKGDEEVRARYAGSEALFTKPIAVSTLLELLKS